MKRQGDILFVDVKELPKDVKIKVDNVVAEGEATGHKHLLEDGILYESENGTLFIIAEQNTARITHEEHNPVTLPVGNYKVVRQREYEPKGWRPVRD